MCRTFSAAWRPGVFVAISVFIVGLKSRGWLNDLQENGVVVIKDVFSKEEVQECWCCCSCLGVDTVSMKLLHHISSNPMFRFLIQT